MATGYEAVKISAYRMLVGELSSLTRERYPVNMFNPFRKDHSPLSDEEYAKMSGSVKNLRSFMKGCVIYGKTEPINTPNIAINNVHTIADILTVGKDEVLCELEKVLDVFKSHKVMPVLYDTFNVVFDEMDMVPSDDTREALKYFESIPDMNGGIQRHWSLSWEDIKTKKAADSNWRYH